MLGCYSNSPLYDSTIDWFCPRSMTLLPRAGSRECLRVAAEYLSGFGAVPRALVVGNHDLEGDEFETDDQNLAAWVQVCGVGPQGV